MHQISPRLRDEQDDDDDDDDDDDLTCEPLLGSPTLFPLDSLHCKATTAFGGGNFPNDRDVNHTFVIGEMHGEEAALIRELCVHYRYPARAPKNSTLTPI